MEPYRQETANQLEHSFMHCHWLHARHKYSTSTRRNQGPLNGRTSQTLCYSTKRLTQTQTYPLHNLNKSSDPPRNMKATIFHINEHTKIINSKLTPEEYRENLKHIYTTIT